MRIGSNISLINRRSLSVGFSLKGGKASWASLKRSVIASGVMHHACLSRFFGDRARAVEVHDDDNQHKSVDSGKLGEFGAFGDTAKSVCSCDGHGGLLRGFLLSSLNLISIA
jgi:hypothetical protein